MSGDSTRTVYRIPVYFGGGNSQRIDPKHVVGGNIFSVLGHVLRMLQSKVGGGKICESSNFFHLQMKPEYGMSVVHVHLCLPVYGTCMSVVHVHLCLPIFSCNDVEGCVFIFLG